MQTFIFEMVFICKSQNLLVVIIFQFFNYFKLIPELFLNFAISKKTTRILSNFDSIIMTIFIYWHNHLNFTERKFLQITKS